MRAIHGVVTGALLLGSVAVAAAQSAESGTVIRIDPRSSVIMLADGRMFRVTPNTVLVVDNQPAQVATLRPGQRVVIQSGEVVALRDGQYVTVTPPVVAQAPPPVLAQAPATAVPAGVRQTIYGVVEEVERNGEVTVRTESDTFEVKLNPQAMPHLRKGDTVTIDLTFTARGAPAASPR
jgi:hypothetical protein